MADTYDVIVVGGGVIGLSIAYYCARDGMRVCLLDRGDFGSEASWAGAGMISAATGEGKRSSSSILLGKCSLLYPGLSAELRELTGIDNGYRQCGGFELGLNQDDVHVLESAAGHYQKEGVEWQRLSASEAHQIEPNLRDDLTACYYIPKMAQVRNPRHLKALVSACGLVGVDLRAGVPVHQLVREADCVTGVATTSGQIHAGHTVVSSGAWSGVLLQSIGVHLPIRPVRGQIAMLKSRTPVLSSILNVGKRYIVPRPDGRILIGSTEDDVGFDKRTTIGGIHGLLSFGMERVIGFEDLELERGWAGLRPGTPDGKPFIGGVPDLNGLIVAAGHFRSGIQLSPGTGILIRQLIRGEKLLCRLDPFALGRETLSGNLEKNLETI